MRASATVFFQRAERSNSHLYFGSIMLAQTINVLLKKGGGLQVFAAVAPSRFV